MNNVIVFFIGVSFLLLGTFRYTEIIVLSGRFLLGFTVAAFFFIVADFFDYQVKKMESRGFVFYPFKMRVYQSIQLAAVGFSALSIILLPHLIEYIDNDFVLKLSDTFLMLSLGVTVCLTSLKSIKK